MVPRPEVRYLWYPCGSLGGFLKYKKRMFDSFVFLLLSTRAYFKGRAYIKIILKNHARSYFAGRSYYRGNTVQTLVK